MVGQIKCPFNMWFQGLSFEILFALLRKPLNNKINIMQINISSY